MIKQISSLNTVSIPKNLSFKSDSIKNSETDSNKQMDIKTKVLIGASALATIAIAGICIAKKGKIKKPYIKPEAPEVKPPEIKPEVKPQTPEVKPTKTDVSEVPVEKPTTPIDVAKSEFQLFEEATSIDEFRKIGRFEKGKAILNNGEPFNGNIAVKRTGKQKHEPILLEYKDGVITKSTTFSFEEPDIVRKYQNGEIVELIERDDASSGDWLTKYSRDKNGNRVITEIKGSKTAYPKEKITTITKENDTVVKTTSSGVKTIYSKDSKVREWNHNAKTDLLCREVTDKKSGKITRYFVNKKTGEVEELIPFEVTKSAQNALPAYKYSYDGNFQKTKFLEVLNEDGSLKFKTCLYDYNFLPKNTPSNKKVYYSLDNNLLDSAELIHDLETGTNRIPFKDVNVYMDAQNPDVILFVGNKNNLSGSYNIKTKEIDGGYYNMQDRIKKILNNIFGNREPININKLYEEMNSDLTSILKDIN